MSDTIKTKIPAEMEPAAVGGMVTDAKYIIDRVKNKNQTEINTEVGDEITNIKGGSSKSIANLDSEINGNGGIDERLGIVEELAEISIDGGDAQIATGSDFDGPTSEQRAKIPTVGAILDGLNDGVYDVSKRNPTGGENSDGKFTLAYILANADTLIPTSWRHGGMTISFVDTSDNKYQQWRYMGTVVTGSPNPFLDTNNWQRDVTEIIDNSYLLSTIENTNGYIFEAIDKYGNKRLFIDVILYKRLVLNGKDVNETIQEIHNSIEDLNSKIYFDSEHETYPSIITEVKPDASLCEIYVDQDDYVCEYIKKDGTKGIAKLLVGDEKCYNLIAKYINGKKTINHTGEKLIGCAYFDGWSGSFKAWRNDSIDKVVFAAMSQQSLSEETGSAIDKNQYLDDWREYYHAVYGNYPPQDASVCTSFPKSAPVVIPTRKPMWGWLRKPTTADVYEGNDINKMYYTIDDEIDLASEYGIDYFLFCFYINDYYPETNPVFDENDNLVDSVVRTSMGNEAVYSFFSSTNRYKIKGAIMICDHQHVITNAKRAWSVNKYIYDNFISDPSYLYFNGRPVIAYYDDPAMINNSIRIKDTLYLHANRYNSEMDGLFAYSSYGFWLTANTPYITLMNDVDMTNKNYCYYSDAPIKIYSVMSGRDNRARNEFTSTDYTVPPTSDEFKEALRKAIRLSNKSEGIKTILIYGWNEYTEGGWLVPSESEVTTVPNNYPTGKYDGTPQRMDGNGNLLYYNFFKLQAIKEIKDEWLNNKL